MSKLGFFKKNVPKMYGGIQGFSEEALGREP